MSTRISRNTASEVATALTASKKQKIEALKIEFAQKVRRAHLNTIPSEILGAKSKFPEYFSANSQLCLDKDFGYLRCNYSPEYLIVRQADNYVKLNVADQKELHQDFLRIEKLKRQYSDLKEQLAESLYQMKSYKVIERDFKEAFDLIPAPNTDTRVAVNVDSLRKALKD